MPTDPSSVSGKLLWLRAKDNTGTNGSVVTTWADKSGLGRDGTASLSPAVDTTITTPAGGRTVRTTNGFFDLPDLVLTGIRSNVPGSSSESVVALFDGDTTTKWFAPSATVWVDFGVAAPLAATTYSLTSGNDSPGRDPKGWTLYGSNDRATWTPIDSRAAEVFASRGLTKTYAITGAASYQYFKLDVTANNGTAGQFQLAELTVGNASGNATIPRRSVEVWLVVKSDSSTSLNGGWCFGIGDQGNDVRYSDSGTVRDGVNLKGNAARRAFTPTLPINAWRLYRVQATPSTYQAWLDNTSQFSGTVTTSEYGYAGNCRLGNGASSSASLFAGNIAETLVVDHALTSTEAADLITYFNTEHGLSVPGGSSGTAVPTTTGTGPVTVGSSGRTIPVTASTGTSPVTVASSSVTTLVGATPITTGASPVTVGSSSATGLVIPVSTTTGTSPISVGSSARTSTVGTPTGADISVGVKVETGALTLLHIVTLPGVEVPVSVGLEAGSAQSVVPLPGVSIEIGCSLIGRQSDVVAPDPRRLAGQWRYVVTDLANTPLGELVDIEHDAVEDGVGEATMMSFTIATDSDQYALIKPIERQCQVWEGNVLRLRGPILPGQPSDDGTTITHKIHDPSWFWRDGRRVITRTPQKNLLHNGDFKNGLTWWTRGYDADSIPKAAPNVRVVAEDFVDDTDGLDPIKAAEIFGVESVTESELSSSAVFWPNLATFRPGGVAAVEKVADGIPTTVGLKVNVIGHTARDASGSNGLGLSLRRAEAAAAIIKKKRPTAVISTKGVGFYDPKPGFDLYGQEQRRVVVQYDQTISGKSKQWMRQTVEVTQPKEARYPLVLTAAAMLKVADDWSVPDANMTSLKIVARRKGVDGHPDAKLPWDAQLGEGSSSISDTDPIDRWIPQTAEATVPADGRPYLVDVYLYAPAALARYTAVGLFPDEMLYFWGQDQATIFKGVMEHIQKPEFGYADLGIGTRALLTGVKRDREFAFRDLTPADTALDGLMGISRGLEWDTITTPTTTTATTFYPRQGKAIDYVLALGANVVTAVPANTRDVGSAIIAQAQGLGSYRAVAYANDTRAFGGTLIQRVITAEQDTPLNELRETAKAELFWARSSTPAYWVDIDPDCIGEVLANTAKGDTVRLILDYPTSVDRLARIVRRQIHPDSLRLMVAFEEA